jgi:hypothetical protein
MRRIFTLFLLLSFFLFTTSSVESHFRGKPIVKLNGKYSKVYFEDIIAIGDNYLPQDIASENYLIDKSINFEIDTSLLPYPKEVINQTSFEWDFGDGEKKKGTKVEHTYTKIGSYKLLVNINYGDLSKFGYYGDVENLSGSDQQQAEQQSVLINIIPNSTYKVPKAIITVDGKKIMDPIVDSINYKDWNLGPFEFNKTFSFDASNSESEGKIVSYQWDMGGGEDGTRQNKSFKYTYRQDWWVVKPGLMITDENGFISHTFVSLQNDSITPGSSIEDKKSSSPMIYLIGGLVGFVGLSGAIIMFRPNKKKTDKKHK